MKQIIFITDALADPRIEKRLREFADNGYEVILYAFLREKVPAHSSIFVPSIVGDISNLPYLKRLKVLFNGIKKVVEANKQPNAVFYLFGLQIAMFFRLLSKQKYIYEEADLVHTYVHSELSRKVFERINKEVIRHSLLSVFTSEGFLQYHYGQTNWPKNVCIVPNRLPPSLLKCEEIAKTAPFDSNHIRFSFVGGIRFESTMCIMEYLAETFPQHEVHFFGGSNAKHQGRVDALKAKPNFHVHGKFKNPDDLAAIYSQTDFVLSTYDVAIENVKYAEPNKLYESIYFRTPIIVTKGTYLAEKVKKLGIGMEVDPLNDNELARFVSSLTNDTYQKLVCKLVTLPKHDTIDQNAELFTRLAQLC